MHGKFIFVVYLIIALVYVILVEYFCNRQLRSNWPSCFLARIGRKSWPRWVKILAELNFIGRFGQIGRVVFFWPSWVKILAELDSIGRVVRPPLKVG